MSLEMFLTVCLREWYSNLIAIIELRLFSSYLQPSNGGIVMVNFYSMFINCSKYSSLAQVAGNLDGSV